MDIIIIRGAPGSGKSETAKELANFFPNGAIVEIDNIRKMVISVDWTNQKEHINMLHASVNLIIEFIYFKIKPVIVVDTFSGDKISGFLNSIRNFNSNLIIRIFALYVTDNELKKRLELRSSGKFKNFEISKNINYDTIKLCYNDECKIDTSNISAKDTAKTIFENTLSNYGDGR